MKEISLKNLKEYLKQRSKEELIGEISDLFTKFEYVKDYYTIKLGQSDSRVLQKYKDIIKDECCTSMLNVPLLHLTHVIFCFDYKIISVY